MRLRYLLGLFLVLTLTAPADCQANPKTGPPTNLHRRFVVQQTKRNAAQGKPVRKNVGVWLSGGYEKTVSNARRSGSRNRVRRFRRR